MLVYYDKGVMLVILTDKGMKANITRRGVVRAGERTTGAGESTIKASQNFSCLLVLQLILKYKNIIKTNLNLMVFTDEITCLK